MTRGQELLAALAVLAGVAVLGRWAVEKQRERDAVSSRNAFPAMRAEEARRAREGGVPPIPGATAAPRTSRAATPPPALRGAPQRAPGPQGSERFVEVDPAAAGIPFRHFHGGPVVANLVQTTAGGLAVFDFDGDGDDDLYLPQGAVVPGVTPGPVPAGRTGAALYRNDGAWRFTDVTEAAGLADRGYGLGAFPADYDGDGDLDLFVARYGPDRLLRNDGGVFTDVTAASGLTGCRFTAGAAWTDADGDGILDLFACGYVDYDPAVKAAGPSERFPGPLAFRGETARLFLGAADGTFRDVTREAGLYGTEGRGMGVAAVDLSATLRPPVLFLSNDAVANFAWERREGGVYTEVGFALGFALSSLGQRRSSMGIAVFDADRDGLPDLAVPDGSGSALYFNLGGRLEDRAVAAGLSGALGRRTGWAAVPVDYDLDGWPDLLITCGALHAETPEPPVLFRNLGGGRFEDVSADVLALRPLMGRGAAATDLDGDGDPDLVILELGGAPVLLRNEGGARRSLTVRLRGAGRNGGALGAVVEVEADGLFQTEAVHSGQGYLTGVGPALRFGLGDADRATRVRVRFPSGVERVRTDVPAGVIEVIEGR